jgi:uncharacterized membrane protein YcaP (DUF421 family)
MDPLRVAARTMFAYVFLLVSLRVSGKRTVAQGSAGEFVMALVLGDLVDDLVWTEVGVLQFVVAAATLVISQAVLAAFRVRGQLATRGG